MAAAIACLPYEKPRLIAVMPSSAGLTQRIEIVGGLPRLPGSSTIFPGDPPAPRQSVSAPKQVAREEEVGTCTVTADQSCGVSPQNLRS
jgi:hypothetical protein